MAVGCVPVSLELPQTAGRPHFPESLGTSIIQLDPDVLAVIQKPIDIGLLVAHALVVHHPTR